MSWVVIAVAMFLSERSAVLSLPRLLPSSSTRRGILSPSAKKKTLTLLVPFRIERLQEFADFYGGKEMQMSHIATSVHKRMKMELRGEGESREAE